MDDQPSNGQPRCGVTPDQWKALARRLARIYLEIERGQRPAPTLAKLTGNPLWAHTRRRTPALGQRVVSPRDIGGVSITRLSAATASVVVAVADTHHGWDALLMEFAAGASGRWRLTDIQRLRDATADGPHQGAPCPQPTSTVDRPTRQPR